jgi:hypothetical protein
MFSSFRPRIRLTIGAVALAAGAITLTGALQASADDLGPFTCTNKSGGIANAPGTVAAIRVAHHDGYDRLVFEFGPSAAGAVPQYELTRQSSATFIRDASGQPVKLEGSAGIRTVLRNSDIAGGVASDLKPRLPEIREVANIGNFERVVSYGVSLSTPACFRVLELSGPTRLVIDVQTQADAPAAVTVPSSAAASALASPSAAISQPATPSDLAATGHPAQPAQPVNFPGIALILGLLVLTAGLSIVGIRRFARK